MASMRVIKRKIKSVKSTQQITKAMNLVAASKLQRAKAKLNDTRPYFQEMKRAIASIVSNSNGVSHPFLQEREVKNTIVILLTGDRGLCGGFNVNVCKAASALMKTKENVSLVCVGTKGRDYFVRRRRKVRNTFSGISEKPFYDDAVDLGRIVLDVYENKEVDEVYLAYTEFKSTMTQVPKITKLLPVDTSEMSDLSAKKEGIHAVMEYEPDESTVLSYIIPKYINTVLFGAMVESAACEQGARMTSMDSATENAAEMIDSYTLQYNRARQGAITQEITEIVSGANALE